MAGRTSGKGLGISARQSGNRVPIEVDASVKRLDRIDHIVVLMMENRSFDHMLGYLSLGKSPLNVDGLKPGTSERFQRVEYRIKQLPPGSFSRKEQDPCHSATCAQDQLKRGFVANYVSSRDKKAKYNPRDIMGYHPARRLRVYDHFARNYCVCDSWFSSMPGPTLVNRRYAVAGSCGGGIDNALEPPRKLKAFVRHLDATKKHDWRWFIHDDAPMLFAVDRDYVKDLLAKGRLPVSWFDGRPSFPYLTKTFVDRVRGGKLPSVSWIDPDFVDFKFDVRRGASNDDHPPASVMRGQELALRVFSSLASSPSLWRKTLLLIVYDEHGGFFDHVVPPKDPPDEDPKLVGSYGVRVPAIVVSPFVQPGKPCHALFDHASIVKTILVRFCRDARGTIPNMGKRVNAANHLGLALTSPTARAPVPIPPAAAAAISRWHQAAVTTIAEAPRAGEPEALELTDFQQDYLALERDFTAAAAPHLAAQAERDLAVERPAGPS